MLSAITYLYDKAHISNKGTAVQYDKVWDKQVGMFVKMLTFPVTEFFLSRIHVLEFNFEDNLLTVSTRKRFFK